MIFPWQASQWQQLTRLQAEQRLPHALLFTGMAGIGKAAFANSFAHQLFCQANSAEPCYKCHACRLVTGHTHPNILVIEPEKEGGTIKVDQIRLVTEFISHSSLQGDYRLVIINPANNMNINAANALLKTLEEPASGALLILIADMRSTLPATILSRCQRIVFPLPTHQQAVDWLEKELPNAENISTLLQMSHGAPLAALALAQNEILPMRTHLFQTFIKLTNKQEDPLKAAAKLQAAGELTLIDLAISWVCDLLRLQVGINDIINHDFANALQTISVAKNVKHNQHFLNYLQQLRKQLCEGVNLNKQLIVESILLRWMGDKHVFS